MNAESIYIHIPFCKTKCPYCDFASWANREHLIEQYFEALFHEINSKCEAYYQMRSSECRMRNEKIRTSHSAFCNIKTIFIGGGTPSLVAPEYYKKLLETLKRYFEIDKGCEFSLELNPGTARDDYLRGYKELGINRISIGAQSFNEKTLEILGRKHSVDETIEAINIVKSCGFTNFNLDFIYSVPGMTKEMFTETIYSALKHKPNHISAYSLTIEPNTPFEQIYKNPQSRPNDDFAFELYFELCKILKEKGFTHYEVSNFAKPGYESKHNLTYWLAKSFYAFGVNAHRFLNGLRTCNIRELDTYISNPNHETIIDFPIDNNFEKIMLSSRLNEGFDIELIQKVTTKSQGEIRSLLEDLSNEGFLELSRDRIHLTDKGLFLNNEILLKLI